MKTRQQTRTTTTTFLEVALRIDTGIGPCTSLVYYIVHVGSRWRFANVTSDGIVLGIRESCRITGTSVSRKHTVHKRAGEKRSEDVFVNARANLVVCCTSATGPVWRNVLCCHVVGLSAPAVWRAAKAAVRRMAAATAQPTLQLHLIAAPALNPC
jgi:hypothetical protein